MNCLRSLGRWDRGFESHSKAWMFGVCVCVYSVCVILCLGSGLRRADHQSKESYRLLKMIKELNKRPGPWMSWKSHWKKETYGINSYNVLLTYLQWVISFFFALQAQFGPWPTSMKFFILLAFLYLRQLVGLLGRVISLLQGLYLYTNTEKRARAHTHTQTLHIHALSGIRTHDPGFRASEDSACLRPLGYRDRRVH
jgi:hypothetical protein